MSKADIRKLTADAKVEFKTKTYDYNGTTVVFKQPSQGQREEIIELSTKEDGRLSPVDFNIWAVIELTYDEEGNKVFGKADYDSFRNKPSGGFIEEFAEQALELMGNSKMKEEEKES